MSHSGLQDGYYYIDDNGEPRGPFTKEQLKELETQCKINLHTRVTTREWYRPKRPDQGTYPYGAFKKEDLIFTPSVEELIAARISEPLTILSGNNNCGKTITLKGLRADLGHRAYLIGCNRFYHVPRFESREISSEISEQWHFSYLTSFFNETQNTENNVLDFASAIASLTDNDREHLFAISEMLIGNRFALKPTQENNRLAPYYIDMDGENLCLGSTGTRLLMLILAICLNKAFDYILIDEPELGLSPKVQSQLARLFFDQKMRECYFKHIKGFFFATHSHAFLDRSSFGNNFILSKKGNQISLEQVCSIGSLNDLQFRMLGNDLELLYLPSAIVIVEGKTDAQFFRLLISLHCARRVTVVTAEGDGMGRVVQFIRDAFGSLEKSPYRDRVMVVLDGEHSAKIGGLVRQGISKGNIVEWDHDDVEHYYPYSIMSEIFGCSMQQFQHMQIKTALSGSF